MKIFKTQEEVNQALDTEGNLIINDSVTFECHFKIAGNITVRNINAWDITAGNINARNINAWDIKARDIAYYAVCFAYKSFTCKSIKGRRENSKHFCLDSEIEILKGKTK